MSLWKSFQVHQYLKTLVWKQPYCHKIRNFEVRTSFQSTYASEIFKTLLQVLDKICMPTSC